MYQMKKLIPVIAVLSVLVSCREHKEVVRDTIPYVMQLAVDTAETFPLLQSYRSSGTRGSIAIIGELEASLELASRFESVDVFDNIDGKASPDSLPDFAGESFDVLMDLYNAPYLRMAADSPDSLREVAVRNAVMAVDSVAFSDAQNPEARLRKARAKIFVLASSLLTEYGRFDIDTLFKMVGREPLIITPVEAMFEKARRDGCRSVAVWAPEAARPAYETAALNSGLDVTVVSTTGNGIIRPAFRDMLRLYRTKRPDGVLDAILLDSFSVDMEELSDELDHIHRQITEEDMAFEKSLSPRFHFIEPCSSLTDACYRLLRERNLFTHDIAFPAVRYYQTEENLDGGFVLVEIGADYLPSFSNFSPYVPDNH